MQATDPPPRYCAYMVRCWTEQSDNPRHPPIWRFSVEDPSSGKRHGFASFELLIQFLRSELGEPGKQMLIAE